MIKYNTLASRLSIVFISIIVCFSIILISYNYTKASQNSYNHLDNLSSHITKNIIEKTRNHLDKTNTHIKILVNANKSDNILKNENQNFELMQEYILQEKHLSSVYTADNYGNFLQVRREPKLATRKIDNMKNLHKEYWQYKDKDFNTLYKEEFEGEFNPRTRFWYKEAKKEQILISNPYIYHSTKKLGITIFYPKYSKENKKTLVAGIDITLDSLTNFLNEEAEKSNCDIALIDNNKRLISSTYKKNKTKKIKLLSEYVSKDSLIDAAKEYFKGIRHGNVKNYEEGIIYFTGKSFKINKNKSWHIVITTPEDVILKEAKEIANQTFMISFIIVIIFIFITIFISKRITQPILELSKNMDELHKLNLNIDTKCDSNIKELRQAQESLASLKHGLNSFSKYMPYKLVQYLIQNDKKAEIGGIEKSLAIMFTDIEGFTSISEKLPPKELTEELSQYFSYLGEIIKGNDGTIDKFIGDSVMAFWNAPFEVEDPIKKAILSALLIQEKLEIINKENLKQAKPIFKTRIGIHYGRTLVGNIGSDRRMNYTIMGDSVNVASKLERKNKKYKTKILISGEVYEKVKNDFEMKYIDNVELKGKSKAIKVYTVLGIKKSKK